MIQVNHAQFSKVNLLLQTTQPQPQPTDRLRFAFLRHIDGHGIQKATAAGTDDLSVARSTFFAKHRGEACQRNSEEDVAWTWTG